MYGNVGQWLGHPPHSLVSWAELLSMEHWGQEAGEDAAFFSLGSQAGQPPRVVGWMAGVATTCIQQDSPETIDTLRETNPLHYLRLDQI